MKKKLRGLLSLWLAAVMVFAVLPAGVLAEEPTTGSIYLYTGESFEDLEPSEEIELGTPINLEFDTSLYEQFKIYLRKDRPLVGWTLWSVYSGHISQEPTPYKITIEEDKIDAGLYGEYYWAGSYPLLQPNYADKYRINPQPTDANPTVGAEVYSDIGAGTYNWLNTTDDEIVTVDYQWCELEKNSKEYIVGYFEEEFDIDNYYTATIEYAGSYANETWTSEEDSSARYDIVNIVDIFFGELEQGDKLHITAEFADGATSYVGEYDEEPDYSDYYNSESLPESEGTYTYTHSKDEGNYNLYIISSAEFTAEITLERTTVTEKELDGRTDKCLLIIDGEEDREGLTPGAFYHCKVTFDKAEDNVTLISDKVTYSASSSADDDNTDDDNTDDDNTDDEGCGNENCTCDNCTCDDDCDCDCEGCSGNNDDDNFMIFPNLRQLSFDVNGGKKIKSVPRALGSTVRLKDYVPEREGHTFTGWYADPALTEEITKIVMKSNMTVYAGWEEN